jgi:predicted lipoprotein
MKTKISLDTLLLLFLTAFLFSCQSGNDNKNKTDFDRKAFLTELAEKSVMPSYQTLETAAQNFQTSLTAFENSQSAGDFVLMRKNFKQLYFAWVDASLFEFGPAENVLLRANLNTFPTSTSLIEANITAGNANLDAASNLSAKGLPALDYMLFADLSKNDETYSAFLAQPARLAYLKKLGDDISAKIQKVNSEWKNGYHKEFSANTGSDAGSSLSLFVNQFNYDYELLKNARIGIPAGVKSLAVPQPERTEALYMARLYTSELISNRLAVNHLKKIVGIFRGDYGNKSLCLKAYLDAYNAKRGSELLSDAILAQFAKAQAAAENITLPFEKAATEKNEDMVKAYDELQKGVILTKTDMPSILGVQITYQDADGD